MTRQEFQQEKEKLSKMNTKEKLSYIWAYYNTQLMIAAAVVFLLVQAGMALYRSTFEDMLYCQFVNQLQLNGKEAALLEKDFRSFAQLTDKKQNVTFDISIDLDDPSYAQASFIKLTSLQSTGTMDTMVATGAILERFHDQNLFLDLDTVLTAELKRALADRLYYAQDSQGNTVPIGISLTDSHLSEAISLQEDSYLAVITMENSPDTVLAFIRYCFESKANLPRSHEWPE